MRFIVDDALKFVRGSSGQGFYEGILMDPPPYGQEGLARCGSWRTRSTPWWEVCRQLLSDKPLFFLINGYTTGLQPAVLKNLLQMTAARARGGQVQARQVGHPSRTAPWCCPAETSGRWGGVMLQDRHPL